MCTAWIVGYDGDNEKKEIYYGKKATNEIWAVAYIYADRDVKISGTITEKGYSWTDVSRYDLNLKKGWNTALEYYKENDDDETWEFKTSYSTSGFSWTYGYIEIR
ncbi:MAG: hypothetical protein LUE10_01335 [Alistipes sp.]|nr:hypothetical protein [Alistipes sp.]